MESSLSLILTKIVRSILWQISYEILTEYYPGDNNNIIRS